MLGGGGSPLGVCGEGGKKVGLWQSTFFINSKRRGGGEASVFNDKKKEKGESRSHLQFTTKKKRQKPHLSAQYHKTERKKKREKRDEAFLVPGTRGGVTWKGFNPTLGGRGNYNRGGRGRN